MPTLSELFQQLSPNLPAAKFRPGVSGPPHAAAPDIDIELSEENRHSTLRTVVPFCDLIEQLQTYFEETCAQCQIEDSAAVPVYYQSLHRELKRGLRSDKDVKNAIKQVMNIVVNCTDQITCDKYTLDKDDTDPRPLQPDLIMQATEVATGKETVLVAVEMMFGRPGINPTLLDSLSSLLEAGSAIQFPTYERQFPKTRSVNPSQNLALPPTMAKADVDGDLLYKHHPRLPTSDSTTEVEFSDVLWCKIQKLWSWMVASNLTFGFISDYRTSFFAVRLRATHSLYLSPPFDPSGKAPLDLLAPLSAMVHLALRDAIDRSQDEDESDQHRAKTAKRSNTDNDLLSSRPAPSSSTLGFRLVPRIGQKGCGAGLKADSSIDLGRLKVRIPATLKMIFRTPYINSEQPATLIKQGLLYNTLPDHSQTSESPSKHTRISPNGSKGSSNGDNPLRDYDPAVGLDSFLVLIDEIGWGASGRVWRGYVDLGPAGSVAVVVKVGTYAEMEHERNVYRRLEERSVSGVPQLVGLYRTPEGFPRWHSGFLILSDEGEPIVEGKSELASQERAVFLNILDQIHGAGILHNDLRSENLLRTKTFDGEGEILSIIDFHQASIDDGLEERQHEKDGLASLLDELR